MAFTPALPRTSTLRQRLLQSLEALPPARRIQRPELSPEQRAHRIALDRLLLERGRAALQASSWAR